MDFGKKNISWNWIIWFHVFFFGLDCFKFLAYCEMVRDKKIIFTHKRPSTYYVIGQGGREVKNLEKLSDNMWKAYTLKA